MSSFLPLITLLGPTAVGKTRLAAVLAHRIGGEVISADSRQVFRGMDIGTGKDLADYRVDGTDIPAHLLDVADVGTEYSVFSFLRDFGTAWNDIRKRNHQPVVCGGTGLYLAALLKGYDMIEVPLNEEFRKSVEDKPDDELAAMLEQMKPLHNTTDTVERERIIRALEIELHRTSGQKSELPDFSGSPVFGLRFDRSIIRDRITKRLHSRLESGMIDEVKLLLDQGITPERLIRYGLEYRFVTRYLIGELEYGEMVGLLNTAIHQFAKRQMTWFRKMEREGIHIHWLEGEKGERYNLEIMLAVITHWQAKS